MWKTRLIALLLLPAAVWAGEQKCVMQDKAVSQSRAVIAELGDIRRDVVPWNNNQKKCIVNFRARIDQTWHQGYGEYIWDGELPVNDACGAAVTAGKKDLTERVKPANIISESVLICNDDPKLDAVKRTQIGSIVDITQLTVNPRYPKRFYHNGAECRWFTEVGFTGKDVLQYQGVACMLEPTKWVVVDKF